MKDGSRSTSANLSSILVALIALVGLLVGVFVLHSEVSGHDTHMVPSVSSFNAQASVTDASLTGSTAAVAVDVATISTDSHVGLLDCVLMALTCVLLLVMVTVVFLTRLPAHFRQLIDSGDELVKVMTGMTCPVPRPNLAALSIYRI